MADFWRFYGVRLFAVLGTAELPWCEFATLVEHLPVDSALMRATGGAKVEWRVAEQLLARIAHLTELGLYQRADPKKRGKPPEPLPSPWDEEPERMSDAEKVARLLDLARRDRERRGVSLGD